MTETPASKTHAGELSKDLYAAIGRVAAEWADFEFLVDARTLSLAKINSRMGTCLTAQIAGPARKLDAYIAVAQLCGAAKTVISLNKFAKDAMGLAERRNRIVHDSWSLVTKEPHRFEATARKVLRTEFIHEPLDGLAKLADQIQKLSERFYNLTEDVKVEVGTWPDKPLAPSP